MKNIKLLSLLFIIFFTQQLYSQYNCPTFTATGSSTSGYNNTQDPGCQICPGTVPGNAPWTGFGCAGTITVTPIAPTTSLTMSFTSVNTDDFATITVNGGGVMTLSGSYVGIVGNVIGPYTSCGGNYGDVFVTITSTLPFTQATIVNTGCSSGWVIACAGDVDAGIDNDYVGVGSTLCGNTLNLNTLLIGADPGGTWTETTSSGQFNTTTGVFNSSGLAPGFYTFEYTVTACGLTDVAVFTVEVGSPLDAGADNTATLCNSAGSTIDLNTLVSAGAEPNGTWSETTTSGQFTAATGILDATNLTGGNYTFEYTVNSCGTIDNAVFTITIIESPSSGSNNTATLCNNPSTIIDLNTLLSPGADVGGVWLETTSSGQFNTTTAILDGSNLSPANYTFTYTVAGNAQCPDTTSTFTITVEQFADAGADNSITQCLTNNNPIDLNTLLNGNNGIGTWAETSASGQFNAATGVLDPSGLSGVFNFTFTVNGNAPCVNDIANFTTTIQEQPDAGSDDNSTICNATGNNLDLNTLLNGNNATGTWTETTSSGQFNTATGILDASTLTNGTYIFKYTITGTPPCNDDESEFSVQVIDSVFAGDDNIATLCNYQNNTLDLNTLLSNNADLNGTWTESTSSGQFNNTIGVFDVSNLSNGVYNFTYTVTAITPCIDDVSNFSITVNESPVFTITGNDPLVCQTDGDIIISGLIPNTNYDITYDANTITIGPNNLTTDNNGEITINEPQGNYNNFTVTDITTGCSTTDPLTITLNDPSSPQIDAGLDQQICNNGTTVTLTAFNPDGANITWSNGINDGISFIPTNTGITTYTVTADLAGCISSDQVNITLNPLPNITANASQTDVCIGQNTTLYGSGGISYLWDNSINDNIPFTPNTTNQYQVIGTDANGCQNTSQITITVNPLPNPSLSAPNTTGCIPLKVNFTSSTQNISTYSWNFGDGSNANSNGAISHEYITSGCYDVTLQVTDNNNCSKDTTYLDFVCADNLPNAQFGQNYTTVTEPTTWVEFTNSSLNASSYKWIYYNGYTSTDTHQSHEFPVEPGAYNVKLVAYTDNNCSDTTKSVVVVNEALLFYVPNAFTPDGDQFNEVFKPVMTSGYDPFKYSLLIFNRWGEPVFESHNTDIGWDGNYQGKLVEDGVYVWKIIIHDPKTDERKEFQGHLNVLK